MPTKKIKFQTIKELLLEINEATGNTYTIGLLCKYTKVPRSSYYKWANGVRSKRTIDNEAIVDYMFKLEEEHDYIYGVESLTMYINTKTKYHAGHNKVRRLMKENGIEASIRKKKHDRHAEHKDQILANLLYDKDTGHHFNSGQSNQVWVTDCTELRYGSKSQYKLRLSAIKDLHDHSIIAWQIADTETSALVTDTLQLALKVTNGQKPKILHSDQGAAYTSGEYNTLLAGTGIKHSMSRAGTPGDNSPMEAFWSHMKDEFFAFKKNSFKR